MARPQTVEIAKRDLFTEETALYEIYPEETVQRLLRLREEYTWFLANPDAKDRVFISEVRSRFNLGVTQAYADLSVIKALLPTLSQASRDFHRYRFNEMILETYQMAKARKDTKTMEKAAASYAKFNRVDLEDEQAVPYEMIVVQPFTATDDPTVLGIKPIPNLQQKIDQMIKHYGAETIDIEDIDYEEADLEEEMWNPGASSRQTGGAASAEEGNDL